jgi:hypothetical protein
MVFELIPQAMLILPLRGEQHDFGRLRKGSQCMSPMPKAQTASDRIRHAWPTVAI